MKTHRVIGLMSGTSLDGLDIAYCHIWEEEEGWKYNILSTITIAYNDEMRKKIKNSIHLSAEKLLALDVEYGIWLGEKVKQFIDTHQLEIEFIASHGHTTHHRPEKGFSYQIGAGQYIANETNCPVICNFRSNDIALGGQGAPLVPIGDLLLFKKYDFCLNIGGICNISFDKERKRVAYDIGVGNMLLNHITEKINLSYDKDGRIASKGKLNLALYNTLNQLEYYQLDYPKSTGYEWFINKVIPLIDEFEDRIENLLFTGIQHICEQISIAIKTNTIGDNCNVLVTGGGALNKFIMTILQEKLTSKIEICLPSKEQIEYKEALIFSLMGVLKKEGKVNALCSVTGASKDSINGMYYYPQKHS